MKTVEEIEKELKSECENQEALDVRIDMLKAELAKVKAANEIKEGDYIVCIDDTFTNDKILRAYKSRYDEMVSISHDGDGYYKTRFRKATRDEIAAHLLKDAEARGFKIGAYVIPNVSGGFKYRIDNLKVIFADHQLDFECDSELIRNSIKNDPFVAAYGYNSSAPIDVLNLAMEDIMVKTISREEYKADFSKVKDKNIVKFGCAEIPKGLFWDLNRVIADYKTAGNRGIESIQIGKGIFTPEIIGKIVEKINEAEK